MKYNHAHHTNVHTRVSPIKDFDRLRQGQHFRFNKIEENELFKYLNRYKTLLSFNANCTHLVPIHIKKYKCGYFRKDTFWYIISKICSFSSTFVLHWSSKRYNATLHSKEVNEVFFSSSSSSPISPQWSYRASHIVCHDLILSFLFVSWLHLVPSPPPSFSFTYHSPKHFLVSVQLLLAGLLNFFHLQRAKLQSIFSTFPIIFSSKMGKIASSSRTSSNTTPQSNSSLTFLK